MNLILRDISPCGVVSSAVIFKSGSFIYLPMWEGMLPLRIKRKPLNMLSLPSLFPENGHGIICPMLVHELMIVISLPTMFVQTPSRHLLLLCTPSPPRVSSQHRWHLALFPFRLQLSLQQGCWLVRHQALLALIRRGICWYASHPLCLDFPPKEFGLVSVWCGMLFSGLFL